MHLLFLSAYASTLLFMISKNYPWTAIIGFIIALFSVIGGLITVTCKPGDEGGIMAIFTAITCMIIFLILLTARVAGVWTSEGAKIRYEKSILKLIVIIIPALLDSMGVVIEALAGSEAYINILSGLYVDKIALYSAGLNFLAMIAVAYLFGKKNAPGKKPGLKKSFVKPLFNIFVILYGIFFVVFLIIGITKFIGEW
ncbi:MAG: hypothetical protein ACFFD2_04265 [Promethearchaeota archaeon]